MRQYIGDISEKHNYLPKAVLFKRRHTRGDGGKRQMEHKHYIIIKFLNIRGVSSKIHELNNNMYLQKGNIGGTSICNGRNFFF